MRSVTGRRSLLLFGLLTLLVLILGLALAWHIVGMSHNGGMAMLGGCLVVLAGALLVLRPEGDEGRIPAGFATLPSPGFVTPVAVQRPPPLGATVLLC